MTLRRATNEQLIADIRKRLSEGYTEATAERVKSIASRTSDPELLRELSIALADAIIDPKKRKAGAPRKAYPIPMTKDGAFNLDAVPAMTKEEGFKALKEYLLELNKCMQVREDIQQGKSVQIACQLQGIGTDTYYKHFPANT